MKRSDFLRAVFPEEFIRRGESPLVSYPATFKDSGGHRRDYYKQMYWNQRARGIDSRDEGWLYCVSTVAKGDKPRRRLQDVREAFVLPCDDVKTKCEVPPVKPSYIMETSKGNYQYGYLLDPFDVSTGRGAGYYDACLLGLAYAGYNDLGCRSASRVIKLPGALHRTGFVTRLVDWHPERSWHLPELMSEMEVSPADVLISKYRRREGRYKSLEQVDDIVYRWLEDTGRVLGHGEEWIDIECPWADEHSDPDSRLAGYSPDNYSSAHRGFNCFHSHGSRYGIAEFLLWVEETGGITPDLNMQKRVAETLRKLENV